MINIKSTLIALLLLGGINNVSFSQCQIAIPANVIVVDTNSGASGFDKHFWVCDTLGVSGFNHFFYIENGGYVSGSGFEHKAFVKAGGEYSMNGVDDTVYYEAGAILSNTPAVAILCTDIIFDYTNAPASNCIITLPPPTAGFIASDDTLCAAVGCVTFTDTSSTNGTVTWSWTFPGGIPSTSTLQNPANICYANTGTYTAVLVVTDSIGTDSATFDITVMLCLGVADEAANINFNIYPNPVKESFSFDLDIEDSNRAKLELYDGSGRLVLIKQLDSQVINHRIAVPSLNEGLYFIKIMVGDKILTQGKMVKLGSRK
jgi:type IX secretion system substrate protein/PKD domain-containing protein